MAKLSKRQSKRLAFLASKLALSNGHDERMALLTELLDELGIDAAQRAASAESARLTLRQRSAKSANVSRDELADYNREAMAKIQQLLAERRAELEPMSAPEPAPVVEEAPQYTVTARQRRRLAAFDDMTDGEQVDQLAQMWGAA